MAGANVLFFGVGCFDFSPVSNVGTREEWKSRVRTALESVPSIRNITIEVDSLMTTDFSVSEDGDFRIHPARGEVGFVVNIPKRIQERTGSIVLRLDADVEEFQVRTIYGLRGPVTFVSCLNVEGEMRQQAWAVALVRHFLAEEIPMRTNEVNFTFTGPSPFHGDMSLRATDDDSFTADCSPNIGYDSYMFTYPQQTYDDALAASKVLFPLLANELSLFYSLVRQDSAQMRESATVGNEVNNLIAAYRTDGFRSWVRRWFWLNRRARKLSIELIGREYSLQTQAEIARKDVEDLYRAHPLSVFKETLERRVQEDANIELIKMSGRTVELLEKFRSKESEVATLALATLLGAIAGAVAALIAG